MSRSIGQHSLHNLLAYDLYEPETKIFINQKSLGWGLILNPLTAANSEKIQILANLLTDALPKKASLQFLLYGSPKIANILDSVSESCNSELIKIQMEYLKNGAYQSLSKTSDFYLRDLKLFIFFSLPKNHPDAKLTSLEKYRADVLSSLRSIDVFAEIMEAENFINLISEIINPSLELNAGKLAWNKFEALNQQLCDANQILDVCPYQLNFKQQHSEFTATCFELRTLPEQQGLWNMQDAIGQLFNAHLQIPGYFLISLNIYLLDKAKVENKVQSKILGQNKKARNTQILTWLPSIAKEYQDWNWVRERLGSRR